ncbi:MAG TPA: NAD(P)-dependent alcohol dehydrogenase, partial [Vicinamibacterales bacterium]|nr:NAD(P)-dependent alcohol dehydrogenase [Vicinamibacterales bacterium]
MKAVLWTAYGPPEVLKIGELPVPEPKRGQVRIKMHATSVTYSDTFVRGLAIKPGIRFVARLFLGFRRPTRWPVLGIVVAGEIDRVGAGVTSFRGGDQVFGMNPFGAGAYAEYVCMKAGKLLAIKPANLTYREAAAIPYGGLLALHFLRAAGVAEGMKVLIYGASGATGSSAVQLAKHFGAHVTGVCSAQNLDLVTSCGADAVIDYTSQDFTTLGNRYDVVFAAIGGRYQPPSEEQCRSVLAPGGRYVTVDGWNPKMTRERLEELRGLAEAGALRAVIDRCYSLDDVAEAHRYVETK